MFDGVPAAEFDSYIAWTDSDGEVLRGLWPFVRPHVEEIVEDFYRRILQHPSTAQIIQDEATVGRLKLTLGSWVKELLNGPWDADYRARRRHVGVIHVRVGVDHVTMFMAMNAMQQRILEIAAASDGVDMGLTSAAVAKAAGMDLALMTGAYHERLQQRRARDLKSLLVANMPAAVMLFDANLALHAITPGTLTLLGTECEIGSEVRDAMPESLLKATRLPDYLSRVLSSGNQVSLPHLDVPLHGSVKRLSLTLVPLPEPDVGVLVHIEDHTAAVETERQLRRQEHLAQIGTMSATIAHELRNPLAGIGGALQVFAAGMAPDDPRAPIMRKVLDQIRSLNRLVTDLLSFARSDHATPQDGVQLRSLCEDVAKQCAIEFPGASITVEGDAAVATDPDLVRHILINLVMNACQAGGTAPVVRIEVHKHELVVADAGPGIDAEVRARLFEPFYTTKLKGTGLGLPLSLKLSRVIDAELEFREGHPLGGAAFALTFRHGHSSTAT